MNFGLAFSFVFQDSEWFKKIILISLISLIPIVGQLVAFGFMLEIQKRVINNDPVPLPELDFGGFLGKGFQAFIVAFVYSIPLIILVLPTQVIPFLADTMDAELVATLTVAVSCICGGLAFIYGLLMAFLLPAAFGKLVTEGSMSAAFKIGEVFGLVRKAPVAFLIALLGSFVAGIVAPLGSIACGIGVLLTTTYSYCIMGHFYGQAFTEAVNAE